MASARTCSFSDPRTFLCSAASEPCSPSQRNGNNCVNMQQCRFLSYLPLRFGCLHTCTHTHSPRIHTVMHTPAVGSPCPGEHPSSISPAHVWRLCTSLWSHQQLDALSCTSESPFSRHSPLYSPCWPCQSAEQEIASHCFNLYFLHYYENVSMTSTMNACPCL